MTATSQAPLTPLRALVLATWFGIVAGYLDLATILVKRDLFHASLYYELSKDFRWVVPVANLVVMMVPGVVLALICWLRPGALGWRTACWLFATLALWGPLFRAPLYRLATLLLAAGAARTMSRWLTNHERSFERLTRFSLPVLLVLTGMVAFVSRQRQSVAEALAMAGLPVAPSGANNILLIVMDTVRAENLGLHGYRRDTTPRLTHWAKKGVQFNWAIAPAPWTFPSHCSFMTGQWPSTLGAHWLPTLDPAYPTLAGFLASRGYVTAGFAANTFWCSYESGMNRGFAHYEDYPLTPGTVLGSTGPGRWILENLRDPRDYYGVKWIRSQSRDAADINDSFLSWLSQKRDRSRPFFAFLNYLDAHEPFLSPPDSGPHFGLHPESRSEFKLLLEYWDRDKLKLSPQDIELARDAYDDCIAALDRRIGSLLEELERRRVLEDTLVIITSDHGEHFGEHGTFDHGFSLYAHEVHVPLLLISSNVPAGRTFDEPVSLRDIPATVADVAGLGSLGSPFPGRSLGEHWRKSARGGGQLTTSAISEVDIPLEIPPQRGRGPKLRGFSMSLVAEGRHYLMDIQGTEELYDLAADPDELRDLKKGKEKPAEKLALDHFRSVLDLALTGNRVASEVARESQMRLKRVLESMLLRQPGGTPTSNR
jgi:arylsulfatase A-like enzyme